MNNEKIYTQLEELMKDNNIIIKNGLLYAEPKQDKVLDMVGLTHDFLIITTAWNELYGAESIDAHAFNCMKGYIQIDFDKNDTLAVAYDKLVIRMRNWLKTRIKD